MNKRAINSEDARKIENKRQNESHGWIQWKGTDVCMDLNCIECGELSHIDGEFAYNIKCPTCGTYFYCNGHIELIKIEESSEQCIEGEI